MTPHNEHQDESFVAHEEQAAAAAAARIGGTVSPDADDPAMNAVYQAGGGEQDGWDEAERELVETASHGDSAADPVRSAAVPERESDRAGAVYGESDQILSSELADDESKDGRTRTAGEH